MPNKLNQHKHSIYLTPDQFDPSKDKEWAFGPFFVYFLMFHYCTRFKSAKHARPLLSHLKCLNRFFLCSRIYRARALILEHKKNLFKHYKRLKSGRARLADLIRVVLAAILDFLCIRSEGSPTTLVQGKRVLNDPNLSLVTVYHGFGPLGTHFN